MQLCILQALYESVKARDPDQKEFLQAVEEVCTRHGLHFTIAMKPTKLAAA